MNTFNQLRYGRQDQPFKYRNHTYIAVHVTPGCKPDLIHVELLTGQVWCISREEQCSLV